MTFEPIPLSNGRAETAKIDDRVEFLRQMTQFRFPLPEDYKFDRDDVYDNTYACFHFAIPEGFEQYIETIKQLGGSQDPAKRWHELAERIRNDRPKDS